MFFTFDSPSYLYLLFIIPFIIFFHFYSIKNLKGKALRFANFEAIARVRGIDIYSKSLLILILNVSIVVSLILAISGLTLHMEMNSSSFSYAIAIDSSESMGAKDLNPDRLSAAKESAKDFIDILPQGTSAGVISFAGNTKVEQKITNNKDSLKNAINGIQLTDIGGTDIYEAYTTSTLVLGNEPNKAIIILSDGQINVGNLDEVTRYAIMDEVIIHTIGIGTVEGGDTNFGLSKLDEDSLKSLAYTTKGKYFNIKNKEEMKNSMSEIVPLTKRVAAIDLSFYMIMLTMILFIVSQFVNDFSKVTI